jgi:hypothetical protein
MLLHDFVSSSVMALLQVPLVRFRPETAFSAISASIGGFDCAPQRATHPLNPLISLTLQKLLVS